VTGTPKFLVALGGALCGIALLILLLPVPEADPQGGAHLRAGAFLMLVPAAALVLIGYGIHRYRKR